MAQKEMPGSVRSSGWKSLEKVERKERLGMVMRKDRVRDRAPTIEEGAEPRGR